MLEQFITPKTVIDAGHYGILEGPSKLQISLFALGVQLYSQQVKQYPDLGLFLLLDDVHGINSNSEREHLELYQLPSEYLQILTETELTPRNLQIFSQSKMRDAGRKLIETMNVRIAPCELVVAMSLLKKEQLGYKHSLGLYDTLKTDNGINLLAGSIKAQEVFGTKINWQYAVFSSPDRYTLLERDQV